MYEPLIAFAGAGAATPLTGFGYLIAKGVREAVDAEGLIGVLRGGTTAMAGGVTAALTLGYAAALCTKGKPKR